MHDQDNDRNIAAAAQQMLKGVQMTGNDVPTYVAIHNWLEAIMQGQLVLVAPVPTEHAAPAAAPAKPAKGKAAPDLNQPAPAQE